MIKTDPVNTFNKSMNVKSVSVLLWGVNQEIRLSSLPIDSVKIRMLTDKQGSAALSTTTSNLFCQMGMFTRTYIIVALAEAD